MIVVKNTKELEEKWDLNRLPDTEEIMVLGGFENKSKYFNCLNSAKREEYERRITYSVKQLKQVIAQMKEIENAIPPNWNQWQRAKYIYEVLTEKIEYNYNENDYDMDYNSNLCILLAKKGICTGYSLLYKEMMDRQNIKCDYIRGLALMETGGVLKHAWNVLTIDEKSFGVDLAWEVTKNNKEEKLAYFGTNKELLDRHSPDKDEKKYNLETFSNDFMNTISTNREYIENMNYYETSTKEKMDIINYAMLKTYQDVSAQFGEQEARRAVRKFVKGYMNQAKIDGLTQDRHVRNSFIENITQQDMKSLLLEDYKQGLEQGNKIDYNDAIIRNEKTIFTDEQQQDLIIQAILEREIEKEERNKIQRYKDTKILKQYFSAEELEEVDFPEKKSLISKAISWLKMKSKQQLFGKNRENISRNNTTIIELDNTQR